MEKIKMGVIHVSEKKAMRVETIAYYRNVETKENGILFHSRDFGCAAQEFHRAASLEWWVAGEFAPEITATVDAKEATPELRKPRKARKVAAKG